jgi:hypothetical protein
MAPNVIFGRYGKKAEGADVGYMNAVAWVLAPKPLKFKTLAG